MANLLPSIKQTFLDADGNPLVGGKLYSYQAGTTTPLATYTDYGGLTANTNPVILDANGQADIWIGQSAYKFVLHDADDVELGVWDGVVLIDSESVTTSKLAPLSVTTAKLADGSVTTIKINNLAVTTEKLANSAVTTPKINDGAVTTDKLGDESITPAKLNDSIYSDVFTERNKIINGDMDFWQRGTTFTSVANGAFTADRWRFNKVGAMVYNIERESTIVPTFADVGLQLDYSMKISCTTADATVDAGDLVEISQPIEGFFFRDLIRKEFVFSFWTYCSTTLNFCVAFKNSNVDSVLNPATKSYVKRVSITAANTWQKITVAVPAPTDGTWRGNIGAVGLSASIVLTAGSTYRTTEGAWQNGNYSGMSTMDNFSASNTNILYVTGFRLEGGSIPRQFESRHTSLEEQMCMRYCENLSFKFIGYNPGVVEVGCFGGVAPYLVPKVTYPATVETSSFTTTTLVSSPAAAAYFSGLDVTANFTAGAGKAVLAGSARVSSELTPP